MQNMLNAENPIFFSNAEVKQERKLTRVRETDKSKKRWKKRMERQTEKLTDSQTDQMIHV